MEFLKNHYEKVILSVVLLGLAIAAAYLPIEVSKVRQSLLTATETIRRRPVKQIEDVDTSTNEMVLRMVKNPPPVTFARAGHNVFNPGRWIKAPDGTPILEEDLGIRQLRVVAIRPLYTRIVYSGVRDSGQTVRYKLTEIQQTSPKPAKQRGIMRYMRPGEKTDLFVLRKVEGPEKAPTAVFVELVEDGREVRITPDHPFEEVAGYAVDLRQETTKRLYKNQRVDSRIVLGGERYKIVAIGPEDVTLANVDTLERTTIRLNNAAQ